MEKEKIHITVTEDYITSYENLSVKFNKGDKIWIINLISLKVMEIK